MTPHVHMWMVYMQFQMPMYMYIDSNNKYIQQQNWIHSHQLYVKWMYTYTF